MVRYPFDTLTVLSKAEGLTTNVNSNTCGFFDSFTLRYRRANEIFYQISIFEFIEIRLSKGSCDGGPSP